MMQPTFNTSIMVLGHVTQFIIKNYKFTFSTWINDQAWDTRQSCARSQSALTWEYANMKPKVCQKCTQQPGSHISPGIIFLVSQRSHNVAFMSSQNCSQPAFQILWHEHETQTSKFNIFLAHISSQRRSQSQCQKCCSFWIMSSLRDVLSQQMLFLE